MGKERGLVVKVTRTRLTTRVITGQEMYLNYFCGKLWGCRETSKELAYMVPCPESKRCFFHEILHFSVLDNCQITPIAYVQNTLPTVPENQ